MSSTPSEGDHTSEDAARRILETVLRRELDRSDGYMDTPDGQSDAVEAMLDALSEVGFFIAHESKAPPWMIPIKPGEYINDHPALYRLAGPEEEL